MVRTGVVVGSFSSFSTASTHTDRFMHACRHARTVPCFSTTSTHTDGYMHAYRHARTIPSFSTASTHTDGYIVSLYVATRSNVAVLTSTKPRRFYKPDVKNRYGMFAPSHKKHSEVSVTGVPQGFNVGLHTQFSLLHLYNVSNHPFYTPLISQKMFTNFWRVGTYVFGVNGIGVGAHALVLSIVKVHPFFPGMRRRLKRIQQHLYLIRVQLQ